MTADRALDALGDSTRRLIMQRLHAGELSVGALAGRLPVGRPAVSKHLRVLAEAGLVEHRSRGTQNFYAIAPAGLQQVHSWLDALWDTSLRSFAAYIESNPEEKQ